MKKYLIDASVIHGWVNMKDKYHNSCKKFITAHMTGELFFPINALFEIHAARSRRLKGNSFLGLPGTHGLKNQKFIDINKEFYDECQRQQLFSFFSELKGSDLIYACIAKLGGFTLVTCDTDFDKYSNDIELLNIIEEN